MAVRIRDLVARVEKLEAEVAEARDLITALAGTVGDLRAQLSTPKGRSTSKPKTD